MILLATIQMMLPQDEKISLILSSDPECNHLEEKEVFNDFQALFKQYQYHQRRQTVWADIMLDKPSMNRQGVSMKITVPRNFTLSNLQEYLGERFEKSDIKITIEEDPGYTSISPYENQIIL